MKILLVHNRYRYRGGEDQVFHREAELLRSKGHSVFAYTRDNSEIDKDGILSKVQVGARTIWATDSQRDLREILLRERPQVVHFHNTFPLISPSAYYACHEVGISVVQSLHNARLVCPAGIFYREGKICHDCVGKVIPWPGIFHSCYRNSALSTAAAAAMVTLHKLMGTWQTAVDGYIVFTEFFRKMFVAAGLASERVFLKPHFLLYDPGAKQQKGEYALYVGRLTPEKGLCTLLEAWKVVGGNIPLRIVGEGPNLGAFEAMKKQVRLSNVYFDGWLDPERLPSVIKKSAFLIFPSESYEAFGLAIIEAFACGVPVIASRLGAVMELIEDGKTGLHFIPGDAKDLASKVEWAWTHARDMDAMGKAARLEYETKYTAERNYQLLMDVYRTAQSPRRKTA